MIPTRLRDSVHEIAKAGYETLAPRQQELFLNELERREKSAPLTLFLLFMTGHYAYLGRWGTQIAFWAVLLAGQIWYLQNPSWIILCAAYSWAFIDMFRVLDLVDQANQQISISVIRDVQLAKNAD